MTRYHIVLGETLKQIDLQDGLYKDTMLGFAYQLGIFHIDNNVSQTFYDFQERNETHKHTNLCYALIIFT